MIFGTYTSLEELDIQIIRKLIILLNTDIRFTVSQDYLKKTGELIDLRHAFSKRKPFTARFTEYPQVFTHKTGFLPDLSILDLLFNLGPQTTTYLERSVEMVIQ
jgi:hypothetical protein